MFLFYEISVDPFCSVSNSEVTLESNAAHPQCCPAAILSLFEWTQATQGMSASMALGLGFLEGVLVSFFGDLGNKSQCK